VPRESINLVELGLAILSTMLPTTKCPWVATDAERRQIQLAGLMACREPQDHRRVLGSYAIERFLYRLGQSPYRGKFALKGATLFRARTTRVVGRE
jgi:hypothetical protein